MEEDLGVLLLSDNQFHPQKDPLKDNHVLFCGNHLPKFEASLILLKFLTLFIALNKLEKLLLLEFFN